MNLLYAAFLGILQGATEFLPVSSSGHLALAEHFFHVEQAGLTFDIALHMGTLIAILIYFRRDLLDLFLSLVSRSTESDIVRRRWLCLSICLGTIPAVMAGVALGDAAEHSLRGPGTVAFTLFAAGLFLLLADRFGSKKRHFDQLTVRDALVIGCAQALALIPGVSRSGSTMTAALFLGLDRPASARFSFLLSAPIIFGAGIYKIPEIVGVGLDRSAMLFYCTGFLSAAISGYGVIALLMRYVRTRSLAVFAYYRFGLAAVVLVVLLIG